MKNRSKFIFLILAIVYCFLAIGKNLGFLLINENVLFGLSVTSLLITLGDVFGTIDDIFLWRNDYNYSLKVASDFLQERISKGCFTIRSFDVCNIKEGIDQLKSNNSPIHPLKYIKKRRHTILSFISTVFFVVAIACFILVPFINLTISDSDYSKTLTILAFAAMCFNVFLNDFKKEILSAKNSFDNDKQNMIESLFSGYLFEFYNQTQHLTAYELQRSMNSSSTEDNSEYDYSTNK